MEFVINSASEKAKALKAVEALVVPPVLKAGEKPTHKVQTVTIADYSRKRSVQQNRAYWKVILKTIEDATGAPTRYWHEFFKASFIEPEFLSYQGRKVEIHESTTDLSTKEFMKYIEQIRLWCIENLNGLVLPEIQSREMHMHENS